MNSNYMRTCRIVTMLLAAILFGTIPIFAAEPLGAQGVLAEAGRVVERQQTKVDAICDAAEAVAPALIESERLDDFHFFVIGTHEGAVREASYRAGGFMGLMFEYNAKTTKIIERPGTICLQCISPLEVLRDAQRALDLKQKGVVVVGMGREKAVRDALQKQHPDVAWPFAAFVDNNLELDAPITMESAADALAMWTFSGELISACTRRGLMPRIFYSVQDPHGEAWNNRSPPVFHKDLKPAPIARGTLARAYLDQVRKGLAGLDGQSQTIRDAAGLAMKAHQQGRAIYWVAASHLPPHELKLGDAPYLLLPVNLPKRKPEEFLQNWGAQLHEGDLVVFVGYNTAYLFEDLTKGAAKSKANVIAFVAPGPPGADGMPKAPEGSLYIDTQWRIPDACLELEGYGPKVLPLSGVLSAVALRMFTEELRVLEKAAGITALLAPTPTTMPATAPAVPAR